MDAKKQFVTMEDHTGEQTQIAIIERPRRVKCLATNRDMLLSLLLAPTAPGITRFNLAVADTAKLPADVQIEDVVFDRLRDCFLIEITSQSFDEVQPGEPSPIMDLPVDMWSVARIADDEMVVKRQAVETAYKCLTLVKELKEKLFPESSAAPSAPQRGAMKAGDGVEDGDT